MSTEIEAFPEASSYKLQSILVNQRYTYNQGIQVSCADIRIKAVDIFPIKALNKNLKFKDKDPTPKKKLLNEVAGDLCHIMKTQLEIFGVQCIL